MRLSIYKIGLRLCLRAVNKQNLEEAYLLYTAHCLEIDVVSFAWCQRGVPKALIGPVVPHGEGGRFRKIPGGQLSREVVGRTPAHGVLVGDGNLVALHGSRFSLRSVWVQLLHHNLISTFWERENKAHI